jgi:nitrate/nitrite-specific signal transduction histidine kinase
LILVSAVSLLSVLISTVLMYTIQRRQILNSAELATNALSNTITANLRHAMNFVDWDMAREMIDAVVLEGTVNSAQIINAQGKIRVSSQAEPVGYQYDRSEPECQICHAGGDLPAERTVVFTTGTGQNVLLNMNLLSNAEDCQKCHGAGDRILGMVMIQAPLDSVEDQLHAIVWQNILLAFLTVALLIGVTMTALRYYIITPVVQLEKGVAEIIGGNLDGQVQMASQDELGRLAQSFNTMRKQLRVSHMEMEDRNHELSVLNEVAQTLNQSLDLETVLDSAVKLITDKLGMESCFIRLVDRTSGRLTLRATRGASQEFLDKVENRRKRPGNDLSEEVFRLGQTIFVPDVAASPHFRGLWEVESQRSYILMPLTTKGKVVGTLGITSYAGRPMNERSLVVIESMASEIGMAIDNALLLADSQHHEQEALTLHQLGSQVSASLALKEVLNAVAEAARSLLEADIGLVGLLDEDHQEVVLKAAAGIRADALESVRIPLAETSTSNRENRASVPATGQILDDNQPVIFNQEWIKQEGIVSFLSVPLERGSQIVGLIEVMTRQQRAFQPHDVQLLMRLAHHVVVAVENARLYRQLRYLTVLEERERLGREIHDHLSQTLGYMSIKTSLIDEMLAEGQHEQAREGLLELKRANKIAYTDVREAIFNLRTPISPGIGLLESLRRYLNEYRMYYGLETVLIVEDEELAEISPEVAMQVMRVIQEALANVRKHAEARKVRILCRMVDQKVCFAIEDDGKGFAPEGGIVDTLQHFGLKIMRERAESVGGRLVLNSAPGRGTQVTICVPTLLYDAEEV